MKPPRSACSTTPTGTRPSPTPARSTTTPRRRATTARPERTSRRWVGSASRTGRGPPPIRPSTRDVDVAQNLKGSLGRAGTAGKVVLAVALTFGAWAVVAALLPHGAPPGIVLSGLVYGSLNALLAIGIVLIYRANKVVNFAQAEFGSVAAVLAIEFKLKLHWNYFLAVGAGLALALIIGALVEVLVIRRFSRAPRLILAVVTIGLAQVLNGISVLIPLKWSGLESGTFATPFTHSFKVRPVVFDANYLMVLVIVPIVLIALTVFLRYTDYGVAIRAAAENRDRANLLGVPVARLSTVVWAVAGFLSALAVILRVPLLGFASYTSVSGGGFSLLLR